MILLEIHSFLRHKRVQSLPTVRSFGIQHAVILLWFFIQRHADCSSIQTKEILHSSTTHRPSKFSKYSIMISVVCSVCEEYLIDLDDFLLSYQQRQRFFNPVYEDEKYDILFLAGENFRCYYLLHHNCLFGSFEYQYFDSIELSNGQTLLCPTSGCRSTVSSIYGIWERKYNDFVRDLPPEDELRDLIYSKLTFF